MGPINRRAAEAALLGLNPVEAELNQRIYWLIRLRWVAASTVFYGTFAAAHLVGASLDPRPLYLIGFAIAGYNSLFWIALKLAETAADARPSHVRAMANGQIVTDLLFLTLLIHFSGGVGNPLSFYFVFHTVIASILLSRRDTFLQASVATGLFSGLVLGEHTGIIPHVTVFDFSQIQPVGSGLFVLATLLGFASTLYLVAYIATSITGRLRHRDREILALNSDLESRARELEEAYKMVTDLEQMKSQYLRKVSHEVRAPMAAIQTSLRVVLDGFTGDVPPKQKEMIARAERRTHGLLSLVGDLLTLSRAREARQFTERRWINVSRVLDKVVALQTPRATARGIVLQTGIAEKLPLLLAEPEALEELLTNLLSNAINYTAAGGRVDFQVDQLGESIRFRVADTGIGIPQADIPKIFTEFYRADNARRFSEEGTGLGLAIARSIVDLQGGQIDVESTVGVGTTFTVLLPVPARPDEQLEEENDDQVAAASSSPQPIEGSSANQLQQGGNLMVIAKPALQDRQAVAMAAGQGSLPELLAVLQRYGELHGPIRKGKGAVFAPISSVADLALDYGTTVLSPKKYLLQPMETLFSVRRRGGFQAEQEISAKPQILFGVHSCDLAAIQLLDRVYGQGSYVDSYYRMRREATLIVAMTCTAPPYDKCFCGSMETGPSPRGGFDLLLTVLGSDLLLEIGSDRGAAAVEGLGWPRAAADHLARKENAVKEALARMPRAMDRAGLPQLMNANFDHPLWSKLKDSCLACGNCALSCPSCYCYNVIDQVSLDTVSVKRTRTWDVCLLMEFAEVHGGNFRKDRDARLKQFMYHKLSYWIDQYGAFGCVGCGRCINACPAGIDITEVAREIRGVAQ